MPAQQEKSSGAVIFREENKKILFLLLKYKHREKDEYYYDLPRGHVEKGEEEKDAVLREIKEETGLSDVRFIEGYKEKFNIFFKRDGKLISKTIIMFLAETKTKDIKLSHEHYGYNWLPHEEAVKAIKFKTAKELIEKAHKFLSSGLRRFL